MSRKEELAKFYVMDFLQRKSLIENGKIRTSQITIDVLTEMAQDFIEVVNVGDKNFIGIEGWLLWINSCLVQKWFDEAEKYEGVKISDVPELVYIKKEIDEFEIFTKKYLGYEKEDGSFKIKNKEINL